MRTGSFPYYVDETTTFRAGFNYWEPSLLFDHMIAYVGYHPVTFDKGLNIVVIEQERSGKRTWFLGTYNGPRAIDSEQMKTIRSFAKRGNRVAGRDLQRRIVELVEG